MNTVIRWISLYNYCYFYCSLHAEFPSELLENIIVRFFRRALLSLFPIKASKKLPNTAIVFPHFFLFFRDHIFLIVVVRMLEKKISPLFTKKKRFSKVETYAIHINILDDSVSAILFSFWGNFLLSLSTIWLINESIMPCTLPLRSPTSSVPLKFPKLKHRNHPFHRMAILFPWRLF